MDPDYQGKTLGGTGSALQPLRQGQPVDRSDGLSTEGKKLRQYMAAIFGKNQGCSMLSGSLSPRHGACSGCGWRNGLQVWRVAANTLNKQSRTADKGWSSSMGVGRGANNSSP
jgi:hypothetical protein